MKILISGDYCPIGRNAEFIRKEEYSKLFNGFENLTKEVDFSIVNLECPVSTSDKAIAKSGPSLKTSDRNALHALKFAGFDLLTLANNHIQDYGSQGVKDTIENAHDLGFATVGAGMNVTGAKQAFVTTLDNQKVAVLNIAENEFCAATDTDAGAYTFDLIDNINEIRKLKKEVDRLILIYHGGREHYQLPTPDQRKRFRFFIDNGADAVVAHHTHCFSGFEYHHGKPIVYSLGNFLFDYKEKYQRGIWTEGTSVILRLISGNFQVDLIPHFQGKKEDSTLQLLTGKKKSLFLQRVTHLSNVIQNDQLFFQEWHEYIKTQESFYLSSAYIKNIYHRLLYIKGILPKRWLRSKHNLLLLNLMRCEAHHEITKAVLKNKK